MAFYFNIFPLLDIGIIFRNIQNIWIFQQLLEKGLYLIIGFLFCWKTFFIFLGSSMIQDNTFLTAFKNKLKRNLSKVIYSLHKLYWNKRYFKIDQQIALLFVHYSECFYHPFFAPQIICPILTSRIKSNHYTGLGF